MQDTLSDKAVTMSDDLRQALNQFLVMRKATETAMNPRIYSPKKDGNIWKHKILVVHFTFSFFFQTLFHPGLGKSESRDRCRCYQENMHDLLLPKGRSHLSELQSLAGAN